MSFNENSINFGNVPAKYNCKYYLKIVTKEYDIQIDYCVIYLSYPELVEDNPQIIITHCLAVDNNDGEWPILDFNDMLGYTGKTDKDIYDILVQHNVDESL
jgi:hypothetical protein